MNEQNERYHDYMLRRMREEDHKMYMENKVQRSIWVTFKKEGIHKYPAALDDPKLATGDWDDVSFLGYPHRHMFHFRVAIEVFHDDREIEFIQFSRWLQRLFSENVMTLDYKSCEMIADEMFLKIRERYGSNREVHIEVSEDGENGCVVTFPKA